MLAFDDSFRIGCQFFKGSPCEIEALCDYHGGRSHKSLDSGSSASLVDVLSGFGVWAAVRWLRLGAS